MFSTHGMATAGHSDAKAPPVPSSAGASARNGRSGLFQPRLFQALLTALHKHGKHRRKKDVDLIVECTARLAAFGGGKASGGRGDLPGLDSRSHRDLCRVMTYVEAEAGDTIVELGDVADGFYIILEGTCGLQSANHAAKHRPKASEYRPATSVTKNAAEKPASLFSEGDAVGLSDCARDGIWLHTVIATSHAILLFVSLVRARSRPLARRAAILPCSLAPASRLRVTRPARLCAESHIRRANAHRTCAPTPRRQANQVLTQSRRRRAAAWACSIG